MQWDLFCQVIDNHGDVGVCWRLSAELAARGEHVRLWIDEPSALAWMAPEGCPGVQVVPWGTAPGALTVGDVVVEAFGCNPPEAWVAALARQTRERHRQPAWINLEYLSAQAYAQRCHGLASPVMAGAGAGLSKRFFYPGFSPATGGLIREQHLATRRQAFNRAAWLRQRGWPETGEQRVSLFCYEPTQLSELLIQLAAGPRATRLLVTAGRAQAATATALGELAHNHPAWNRDQRLVIEPLPYLKQTEYDQLLWACDLNFVRGEDSLVRALWAGAPWVWQIYPQDDGAHHAKLEALLDTLQVGASLRAFHEGWNSLRPDLPALDLPAWQGDVTQAALTLREVPELVTQLQAMAREI